MDPHQTDIPWRGPTLAEWVARINDGAMQLAMEVKDQGWAYAGGRWSLPWINESPADRLRHPLTRKDG